MTRVPRGVSRSSAIDGRTRARRIANLRTRQVFMRQPETQRRARLAWLAQLAGAIDARSFTEVELRDAQAALEDCNPRQRRLDLRTKPDASA